MRTKPYYMGDDGLDYSAPGKPGTPHPDCRPWKPLRRRWKTYDLKKAVRERLFKLFK